METRSALGRPVITGSLQVAALLCFGAVAAAADADAPTDSAILDPRVARNFPLDASLEAIPSPVVSALRTEPTADGDAGNISLPQGNEMSVIAGLEMERTDRRFRSRVVKWARNQSVAAGLATDFLLHGSDTGVHLDVQSRSSYVIRWRKRF
jgi:hypothetical protein